MAANRTIYHSHIKAMVRDGLLEQRILTQIPRSNIHRWKNEDASKYNDFGLPFYLNHEYEVIKSFAHNKTAKRVYTAYFRLIHLVLDIVHPLPGFRKAVKEFRFKIVNLVVRVKKHIGISLITRLFNISAHTLKNWSVQTHTQCFESLTRNCYRIFPNQLSKAEVLKLKDYYLIRGISIGQSLLSLIMRYEARNYQSV